jgi:hypothetical protein
MWCHYCEKNNYNHNTPDYRAIAKFKQQGKAHFEAKDKTVKKSLALLFLFQRNSCTKKAVEN